MLGRDYPPAVQADFPIPSRDEQGRLSRVRAVSLEEHLALLERCRRRFLEEFRAISLEQWRTPRPTRFESQDTATPEWIVFHLIHHEGGHAAQISSLRARGRRTLWSSQGTT